ncbi:MAG: D-alanyl-D-alanine carboxypeptidase, partial [Bacteroidota bacterium]
MARTITLLLLLLVLVACKSTKFPVPAKKVDQRFTMDVFKNHFSGFILVDPQTKDTIYEHNSEKYFTPASNTKIVTLYTALKILPDKIPALTYMVKGDTLFVEGTGDPSLLHPYFQDSTAIHFLRDHAHIKLNPHNFQEEVFGPGWAWDDYQYKYSAERS